MSNRTNTALFEQTSIPKAVLTLAVPTVISQLINIIYNFADTWFVGQTGNPAMVAALSIVMPIYVILAGLANLFGIGGASVISRCLGMKQEDKARKVFAFSLYAGMASAIIYGCIMLVFRPIFIHWIGADASSYPYVYDYIFWTMFIGAIPTVGNLLCAHLIRSIGAAKQAGFGMSMGGILNIILDPIFMFVLLPKGHEVTGAAIATCISNTISLLYFLVYLYQHRDHPVLTLHPRDISTADHIPAEVVLIGFPAALQTILAMTSNIFANALVKEYGSTAVAGMGVAKKMNMIAFNTTMGLTQGVLPLLGYCYGAKKYERMKKTIVFTGSIGVVYCILCTICFRAYAPQLVRFFIDDAASIQYGTLFLRIIAFSAPLACIGYLGNSVFQAAGKKKQSLLISILRKGLLDIPAMFIFKSLIGVTGVVWATPFADILSVFVVLSMFYTFFRSIV